MKDKALDIETMRNGALINNLPELDIKFGNLVDPVKIAAKKEEAKAEQLEKMTLNPLFCRVCSVAIVNDDREECFCIDDDCDGAEIELLEWTFSRMADSRIITFNGNSFDMPMLYRRGVLTGVDTRAYGLPSLDKMIARYNNHHHIDMMPVWCGYGNFEKLDTLLRYSIGESKIKIDFHEFPELIKTEEGRKRIREYNIQDTSPLWRLWLRCQGILI